MVYFVRRYINVIFSGAGKPTIKLTNHRTSARITVGGGAGLGAAQVSIYGMKLDLMNELATFARVIHPQYDWKLIIEAGDEINGMNQVFEGAITQAWGDFQSQPEVPFQVVSQAGISQAVMRTGTQDYSSYEGDADVPTMLAKLAKTMGLKFENGGVNAKLPTSYYYGSPLIQAKQIVNDANISMVIENGTLAIWPIDKPRPGAAADVNYISPQTGMVSYPTFTAYGLMVKTEFRKPIKYGTEITVQSDLKKASSRWSVRLQDYDLQALTPNGHWFLSLGCVEAAYTGPMIL
jgi:hypothetical protein